MTITGISTSSTASLSLISGTSYSSDTSAADVLAQGQGTDEAKISKGGQQMSTMAKLASSDPDKFKEAAQKISDALTEKAADATDSNEADALNDMAAKWADAASTGSMDSLKPSDPPSGTQAQSAAMKFKSGQSGSNPMSTMDSVVSSVLSGMGISTSSSSSSTSSGASASSYYSVASTSDTAA